jgi:hypothetical protein
MNGSDAAEPAMERMDERNGWGVETARKVEDNTV